MPVVTMRLVAQLAAAIAPGDQEHVFDLAKTLVAADGGRLSHACSRLPRSHKKCVSRGALSGES